MEVGGEEHAGRRQSEANGAESETFLFTEIIRHGSGTSAADDAPDERAPRGPARACRDKMKHLGQIANAAAAHNVVLTEKQATQSGDAARHAAWAATIAVDGRRC